MEDCPVQPVLVFLPQDNCSPRPLGNAAFWCISYIARSYPIRIFPFLRISRPDRFVSPRLLNVNSICSHRLQMFLMLSSRCPPYHKDQLPAINSDRPRFWIVRLGFFPPRS